jgi:hypothetical protein
MYGFIHRNKYILLQQSAHSCIETPMCIPRYHRAATHMLMSEFTVSELREHLDAVAAGNVSSLQPRLRRADPLHPDADAVLAELDFAGHSARWEVPQPAQFVDVLVQPPFDCEPDVECPAQDLFEKCSNYPVNKWMDPFSATTFACVIDLDRELSVYANSDFVYGYFKEVPYWNALEETPLSAFGGAYVLK